MVERGGGYVLGKQELTIDTQDLAVFVRVCMCVCVCLCECCDDCSNQYARRRSPEGAFLLATVGLFGVCVCVCRSREYSLHITNCLASWLLTPNH